MEEKYYILTDDGKKLKYSPCMNLSNTKDMKNLGNDIKIKIISLLDKKPMYPSELAVTMKTNEQNLYYHTNQMLKSGILEISDIGISMIFEKGFEIIENLKLRDT